MLPRALHRPPSAAAGSSSPRAPASRLAILVLVAPPPAPSRVDERLVGSTSIGGISAGKMPRSPKNSRRSTGTSDRARNFCERLDRNPVQRLVGGLADLAIRILEQQHEDRELLVGARRERALRRLRRTSRSTSPRLKKSRSGVGPITAPADSLCSWSRLKRVGDDLAGLAERRGVGAVELQRDRRRVAGGEDHLAAHVERLLFAGLQQPLDRLSTVDGRRHPAGRFAVKHDRQRSPTAAGADARGGWPRASIGRQRRRSAAPAASMRHRRRTTGSMRGAAPAPAVAARRRRRRLARIAAAERREIQQRRRRPARDHDQPRNVPAVRRSLSTRSMSSTRSDVGCPAITESLGNCAMKS